MKLLKIVVSLLCLCASSTLLYGSRQRGLTPAVKARTEQKIKSFFATTPPWSNAQIADMESTLDRYATVEPHDAGQYRERMHKLQADALARAAAAAARPSAAAGRPAMPPPPPPPALPPSEKRRALPAPPAPSAEEVRRKEEERQRGIEESRRRIADLDREAEKQRAALREATAKRERADADAKRAADLAAQRERESAAAAAAAAASSASAASAAAGTSAEKAAKDAETKTKTAASDATKASGDVAAAAASGLDPKLSTEARTSAAKTADDSAAAAAAASAAADAAAGTKAEDAAAKAARDAAESERKASDATRALALAKAAADAKTSADAREAAAKAELERLASEKERKETAAREASAKSERETSEIIATTIHKAKVFADRNAQEAQDAATTAAEIASRYPSTGKFAVKAKTEAEAARSNAEKVASAKTEQEAWKYGDEVIAADDRARDALRDAEIGKLKEMADRNAQEAQEAAAKAAALAKDQPGVTFIAMTAQSAADKARTAAAATAKSKTVADAAAQLDIAIKANIPAAQDAAHNAKTIHDKLVGIRRTVQEFKEGKLPLDRVDKLINNRIHDINKASEGFSSDEKKPLTAEVDKLEADYKKVKDDALSRTAQVSATEGATPGEKEKTKKEIALVQQRIQFAQDLITQSSQKIVDQRLVERINFAIDQIKDKVANLSTPNQQRFAPAIKALEEQRDSISSKLIGQASPAATITPEGTDTKHSISSATTGGTTTESAAAGTTGGAGEIRPSTVSNLMEQATKQLNENKLSDAEKTLAKIRTFYPGMSANNQAKLQTDYNKLLRLYQSKKTPSASAAPAGEAITSAAAGTETAPAKKESEEVTTLRDIIAKTQEATDRTPIDKQAKRLMSYLPENRSKIVETLRKAATKPALLTVLKTTIIQEAEKRIKELQGQ